MEATSKGDSARDVAGGAKSAECWVLGACVCLAAGVFVEGGSARTKTNVDETRRLAGACDWALPATGPGPLSYGISYRSQRPSTGHTVPGVAASNKSKTAGCARAAAQPPLRAASGRLYATAAALHAPRVHKCACAAAECTQLMAAVAVSATTRQAEGRWHNGAAIAAGLSA